MVCHSNEWSALLRMHWSHVFHLWYDADIRALNIVQYPVLLHYWYPLSQNDSLQLLLPSYVKHHMKLEAWWRHALEQAVSCIHFQILSVNTTHIRCMTHHCVTEWKIYQIQSFINPVFQDSTGSKTENIRLVQLYSKTTHMLNGMIF